MSFGFGVGDIIQLTAIIKENIKNIRDAPAELQQLAERVDVVQINLHSISRLPLNTEAGPGQSLAKQVERIREVLHKIRDIVVRYRDTNGWRNAFDRAKYGIWEKGGVGDLVNELEQRTHNLTFSLIIQILIMTNQMRPQVDQIFTSLLQRKEHGSTDSPGKEEEATICPIPSGESKNPALISNQIDQVKRILEQALNSEDSSSANLSSDQGPGSIEKEIETKLKQSGIDGNLAKSLLKSISEQQKQLVHPEDIDPISYIGGKNRLETPKGWIMVVDSFNEVRSIIAQTYLELVRVWTANYKGEWLFNRVESAGVQVETDFSRRAWKSKTEPLVKGGNSPEEAALKAISGAESHFRSEEKQDILARVGRHKSRGIDHWHFRKYEFMLCFDKNVYEALKMLAKRCKEKYGHLPDYANMSKIVLVKDIRLQAACSNLDTKSTSILVESIKDGIKSFLKTEYGWQRPPIPIADGQFRTKQIVVRNDDIKVKSEERGSKLNEVASRTNCRIRVTDEKFDGQLFSITGRKESLSLASAVLREILS